MGSWLVFFMPTGAAVAAVEEAPDACLYHPPRVEQSNDYRGRIESSNDYRVRNDECD
jgi:hypothetical protein